MIAWLAPLVFALLAPVAQSPRAAALVVFGGRPTVERTNVAGRYAVVFVRDGTSEGQPYTGPVLVEKFGFGWQAIDFIEAACQISRPGLSASDRAILAAGVPERTNRACGTERADVGPARDVEAIRRIATFRGVVPFVAVSGNYGFNSWYGAGGGENLYARTGTAWHRIGGGGGAMTQADAMRNGVPRSAARAFGLPVSFGTPAP